MFNPSRDEVRRFFCDTWGKYRRGEALAGLEQTALGVIVAHPEYHDLFEDPQRASAMEFSPEDGALNPFLHLSLHLAIEEQLAIDQPPGIQARYRELAARMASDHDAKHAVLECLGETIWEAQRAGRAPDQQAYLECLRRRGS